MSGFDLNLIPMIFLIFQITVIGLFVLVHLFSGRRRGLVKTSWFFIGEVIMVLLLFWGIGLIQTNDWITEAMVRQYASMIPMISGDLNQYMDQIVDAGALPLLLAIMDLSIKISIFVLAFTILRFLFKWIIFGIPWAIFIKPIVKDKPKNKLLGGLVGVFRGVFSGFVLIFPVLILINTVVGQGVEIEDPEYQELAITISKANDYNFVKYVNQASMINNVGLADFVFDLAFRSKVNDEEVIIWRTELSWIAEAGKMALPFVLGENSQPEITLAEITKYEGAFSLFAESQLINSSVKPLMKFSLLVISEDESFDFLTNEEVDELIAIIDNSEIDLANDINSLYTVIKDLLTIQDYSKWQETINDYSLIADFNEEEQNLFIGALQKIVSLDILKLADPIISIGMYDENVVNQINWLESPADKVQLLNNVRNKIKTYEGEFVTTTLEQLVTLFDDVFYQFPGIDLDGNGTKDLTLTELLSDLGKLTNVLNNDPEYHVWFKEVVEGIADLSVIDVFMEPIMGLAVNQITGNDSLFSETEFNEIKLIIEQNFATQDDLRRELIWIAEVYEAIGNLHIGAELDASAKPVEIIDRLLSDTNGQLLFKDTIDKFLEGTTISALTESMSDVLISKYLTEPAALAEPLNRATVLDDFSLKTEIDVVLDVLFALYDEGFSLNNMIAGNENMLNELLPSLISYVRVESQKDLLLSSKIMYSFLDYNFKSIPMFEIPDVSYETSGPYNGWIKKTELSALFSVLDGLLIEMEAQNMELTDLLEGFENMNDFFPVIKAYANSSENRTTLLSSDIIYKTIDDLIKGIDLIEIPESAVDNDTHSPYYEWTQRLELNKILESLVIMDIDMPQPGESMDLNSITGEQIHSVILVESKVMTRLLTTYIKDANIFDIPDVAYTDHTNQDLKQEELQALGELLVDLNLSLGDLIGGDTSNLLSSYTVSNLTALSYQNSYLMQGFITYGIKTGIGNPHPLAMNATYPEILSITEITEIFKILNALDTIPSMSVQDLMDTLNPTTLTYAQTNTVVQNGDSIVIRALFSENLLQNDMIVSNNLNLQDVAYHYHLGVKQTDLISYQEMQKLVLSLSNLSDPEDIILDSMSLINTDTLTIQNMIDMVSADSSIVRTLMSDSLITYVTPARILDDAYDSLAPNDLTQLELENFLNAIAVLDTTYNDGNDANDAPVMNLVSTLSTTQSTLTIGQMKSMHSKDSLIMQKFMSEGIVDAVGLLEVRQDAFVDIPKEVIKKLEITNLLDTLNVIALKNNSDIQEDADDESLSAIISGIGSSIELDVLDDIATINSIIVYRKLTNVLASSLPSPVTIPNAALQVHAYTGDDITQTELQNLIAALNALGFTDMNVGLIDSNATDLVKVKDALTANSLIVDRIISDAINQANIDTVESHEGTEDPSIDIQKDELVNLVDGFIAFNINSVDDALTLDFATFMTLVSTSGVTETEFNGYIDYTEPYDPLTENIGLTIFKDFIISKSQGVPFVEVNNRQEVNQLFFP